MSEEIRIIGEVVAIYYENSANFYKVMRVRLEPDDNNTLIDEEIVVTGQFASIHLETLYEFFGQVVNHPKYGEQVNVNRYQQKSPTSKEGLIEYLSSYRFKGIGKVLATRIVEQLGLEAIQKIIDHPQLLHEIPGLSQRVADQLKDTLVEQQGTERIFIQLNQWGFGPKLSEKIYAFYQNRSIEVIRTNPYELIETIDGISFSRIDHVAKLLEFSSLSPERLIAALFVAVRDLTFQEGDTYVEETEAIHKAQKILESHRNDLVELNLIAAQIQPAVELDKIIRLANNLMMPSLHFAELSISRNFQTYYQDHQSIELPDNIVRQAVQKVEQMTGFIYDDSQKKALQVAIQSPMSIITGGPGTGKTTLIKGLIQVHALLHDYDLEKVSHRHTDNPILLAAPTGRAAKRMQEATGLPAQTIHRMIGYTRDTNIEDFYGQELEGSLLIIDEMSMVDTWLMNWLLQAIPVNMQVVFVGDRDQLPSVGPGKIFDDLIQSNIMPVVFLEKIYRQAQDSSIVNLAHQIRQGQLPEDFLTKQADRSFIKAGSSQATDVVTQIVSAAVNKGYPMDKIQVLAPMYKGPGGINEINYSLQALVNPPKKGKRELLFFEQVFRLGDKVLQLVNNTEDEVYNGDIGVITSIYYKDETDSKTEEMTVTFDKDREITYQKSDLDQLTLAYCISIHKAQGSEYPLVIIPIVQSYSRLIQKDLIYTGITRAQNSLVMVGNPNCFYQAISRERLPRKTNLLDLLELSFQIQEEIETSELNLEDASQTEILTESNWMTIDPMINMENLSPYDFMVN